ncbi:MAG: YidC/Oxa1 family membrane protein insertase [Clostridiales bacterium]|nr:YidC/Oxa1 family membrane protein insertase [Clostridiales bacterium]
MVIFQYIGSIFGYVLWFLFELLQNYGLAIIIFTVIIRIVMFPMSVKQQKTMAINSRISVKQQEIRKKYAGDQQKMNEEIQKLYDKEGISPSGGCLTSLLPLFMMMGVFYSVIYPLNNTLHIATQTVQNAIAKVATLPGMGISSSAITRYEQISFLTNFKNLQQTFPGDLQAFLGFSGEEYAKIKSFSGGFNFGLNLLETPSNFGIFNIYFLIPVLCFVTSVGSTLVTMRISKSGQTQQGCMKLMFIGLPLFTAWLAYSVPAAVGFYWICSTVISFLLTLVLNKFYNAGMMTAQQEAQRVALLEIQEKNVHRN